MNILVIIAWYKNTYPQLKEIREKLEKDINDTFDYVFCIDNSGRSSFIIDDMKCNYGTNSVWEFSGYLEGIRSIDVDITNSTVVVINDSYIKNWDMCFFTKRKLKKQINRAKTGSSLFLFKDSIQWPGIGKKHILAVNSRILVFNGGVKDSVVDGINKIIKLSQRGEVNLMEDDDRASIISCWLNKANCRWTSLNVQDIRRRINIEHSLEKIETLCDGLDVQYYPNDLYQSVIYSSLRKLFREKR